jgi:hypothetical protein
LHKPFDLLEDVDKVITYSEWATLAQGRAGWLKLVTKHESAFRHRQTAAEANPVRHQ